MGLDPVSVNLDQKLLEFMDQLELLEEKRQRLNSLIEEGWFNISKARYSMGNKQVSALQFASEIEPQICVHSSLSEKGNVEFKCERTEPKTEELEPSGTVENIGPKEGGLRRRTKIKQKETTVEETSKCEKESQDSIKSEKSPCQHQDPLKWFGILVPQNLKQAQAAFKEVITLSAEIATLQSAILATRMEMQTQMKEKHKIQSVLEG
ncbi:coiled-coil domain-containing protein 115 [Astyanax mexicanus]|uniref:Vacuolar ATPase assembly protein VMA22 n=1 Tax=Astyanax mexicanus TaxID=7994 RepID=A0A3B1INU8_ASTMX|nr:coiled-coil domain-containing protein 115 [Astyanax mexicanus]